MALHIMRISSWATEGKAAQKSNRTIAGRNLVGGLLGVLVSFCFLLGHGRFVWSAVAEVSLMRSLASMSIMLLRPCLPHIKRFCWESAQWVMAPEMV